MKGSDDYASRRPRPRPSAPPPPSSLIRKPSYNSNDIDEDNDEDEDDQDFDQANRYPSSIRRNGSSPTRSGSSSSNSASRAASRNSPSRPSPKEQAKSRAEREAEKKEKKKKLRTLLSNQAICLAIIFALVAGFNWMAADYSGEYIGQDPHLGLVKFSLVRQATSVDGELSYKGTTNLVMQQGSQPKDQQADLTFIAEDPSMIKRGLITRARFIGTVDSSTAEGAIVDAKGSHDVKLTKNIVASLFKQLQHHTPSVQLPRPPKLFQVPVEAPRAPLPNETESTKPFTYGGSDKPAK